MLSLSYEPIIEICELLTDREKIRLSMVSKYMDRIKYKLTYHEKQKIEKIRNLSYFNNFSNICVSEKNGVYPIFVKQIFYDVYDSGALKNLPSTVTHLTFNYSFNDTLCDIPQTVTHLELGCKFYRYETFPTIINVTHLTIYSCIERRNIFIPSSVKNLKIYNFDGTIEKNIPESVSHLTLVRKYWMMPECIPTSITHLIFDDWFGDPVDNLTMLFVTHLTFGKGFNHPVDKLIIPNVAHLVFGERFNYPIDKLVMPKVTHLTFGECFDQSIYELPSSIIKVTISKTYRRTISKDITSRVQIMRI
uniref:F-box domain-containing protein n=1 Tax=viral metagenome TaxID=1070528 RepID=A0A6C0C7X7_9ZZZZ